MVRLESEHAVETSERLAITTQLVQRRAAGQQAFGIVGPERQGMIDELRGAKDGDFDNRYLAQQVDAHNEALTLMDRYAKDGDTPAVKSFAAKTKVAVQEHLDMAKELFNKHNS